MFIRVENSNSVKPSEVDTTSSKTKVYVRKNFSLMPATEDRPEHWEFDEWAMSKSQYEVYETFKAQIDEQADALIELAGILTEV